MKTSLLQDNFAAGMKRDFPRNQMPPGSLWTAIDVIYNDVASIRSRNGWANVAAVSSLTSSASEIKAGISAPFSSGTQQLCVDEDGALYKFGLTGIGAVTAVTGLGHVPYQNPVFHDDLVIFPVDSATATNVKVYNATSVTAVTAAPKGRYADVWGEYTILAAPSTSSNTLYFSAPGDPETWDTSATGSWIRMAREVKGVAALRNAILVFHENSVSRIRGSTPPPDDDMTVDTPLFYVGLLDARSVTKWNDRVIWAAPEGVCWSDGVSMENLAKRGGMLAYWQSMCEDVTSDYTFSGGVVRDTYFLAVLDRSTSPATYVDGFTIDLNTYAWARVTNLNADCMWPGSGQLDELYFGYSTQALVGSVSSIWSTGSTFAEDGTGGYPTPTIETAYYMSRPSIKLWKRLYLDSQIVVTDPLNPPTYSVEAGTDPLETSAAGLLGQFGGETGPAPGPLNHERLDFVASSPGGGIRSPGVFIRITLDNAGAGNLYFYALEAEVEELEGSRL